MAGKTRELKSRMKAVGGIQRITKTMQMIATARFQALQKLAMDARAYSEKLSEVVGQVAVSVGEDVGHPLLQPASGEGAKDLLLVISSNRGLCGGYNAALLRTALNWLKEEHAEFVNDLNADALELQVAGKKGQGFFKFNGLPVSQFYLDVADKPEYELVNALAEEFMAGFIDGKYRNVYVVSTRFRTMSKQEPVVTKLLPLEPPASDESEAGSAASADYEFVPDAESLLAELLPQTVKTELFQCFNEAVVSEQLARMVAMKAATDAAGKQKKAFSQAYNRARQASITTELNEIISGMEALSAS